MTTAETKVVRKLSDITKAIKGFKKKYEEKPDCSTDAGYKDSKQKAKELAAIRIEAEKAHKAEKAKHLEAGRKVDAEKKAILQYITPRETTYKSAYVAVDTEREQAKQREIDAENNRVAAIQALFDEMTALELDSHELSDVTAAIEKMENLNLQDFQERAEEAETAAEKLLELLQRRKARLEAQAAEDKRLADAKAEQEAEAKRLQDEREKLEADQREREQKLQKEKDDFEAEKKREAERVEAEAAEKKRAEEAAAQAEKDKAAAVEQAKKEERDRIKEEKRKAAEAEAERQRIAALQPDAIKLRAWFNELDGVALPEMATDDGKALAAIVEDHFRDFMGRIDPVIADSEAEEKAA